MSFQKKRIPAVYERELSGTPPGKAEQLQGEPSADAMRIQASDAVRIQTTDAVRIQTTDAVRMQASAAAYNAITQGTIWKEMILYCLPLIIGNFFQQLYNTVDAVVVGRFVGKVALSAVGGSSAVLVNVFVQFFVGLSSGAGVVVAQYYGAGNRQSIRYAVHTAMALSVVSGILLTAAGLFLSPVLSGWLGTPAEVMEGTVLYLRIYFLGMVPNLLYNMGAGILRAVGDSKKPLYFLILSCGANIGLDLLFVMGFGMGVAGVAIATVLCQLLSAALVILVLMRAGGEYRLMLREVRFHGRSLGRILTIGLPAGMQSLMYTLSNLLIQAAINGFGTNAVAAWTAYGKLDSVYWMVCSSFGVAITTFTGQNYGAGAYGRVRACVRQCLYIVCPLTLLVSALLYFQGGSLYILFTEDAEVIRIGTEMLRYLTPFYITYIGIEIFSGALRGMGSAMAPMGIDIVGICALRVLWILLALPVWNSIDTIMASYPITWITTSLLFVIYYLYFIRKHQIA